MSCTSVAFIKVWPRTQQDWLIPYSWLQTPEHTWHNNSNNLCANLWKCPLLGLTVEPVNQVGGSLATHNKQTWQKTTTNCSSTFNSICGITADGLRATRVSEPNKLYMPQLYDVANTRANQITLYMMELLYNTIDHTKPGWQAQTLTLHILASCSVTYYGIDAVAKQLCIACKKHHRSYQCAPTQSACKWQ